MAKRKQWGDLSKDARDRAASIAERRFGLTRRQVRERYNRGSYNPFARGDPLQRVPAEFRGQAVEVAPGQIGVDWSALALQNMTRHLGDFYKWSEDSVVENLSHASDELLRVIATATTDEIMEFAFIQNPEERYALPRGLSVDEIGYYVIGKKSGKPEWVNIFWYH